MSVIALIVLLAIIWQSAYMDARKNKIFRAVIFSTIFALLGYIARGLLDGGNRIFINYLINLIIYVAGVLICYFILLSALKRKGIIFKIATGFGIFMLLFILTSPLTHFAFYIDESGFYQRGSLNFVVFVSNIIFFVSWICVLAVTYRNVELKKRLNIYLLGIFQVSAIIIEMFAEDFKALYVGGAFLLGIYYVFMMEVEGRYDQMTGVFSKRYYYSEIERLNINDSYIVFMLDVNRLKHTNDNFGHAKGDLVIKTVSQSAWETMHSKAKIFRVGGDEFVGISTIMNEYEISECFKEIANKLEKESKKLGLEVSASMGYSIHNVGEDFETVLERADENMYKSKSAYYERVSSGR